MFYGMTHVETFDVTSGRNYGVIWADTVNIGDDIQTLAALNFLAKKNIKEFTLVNRERLSDYEGAPLLLIMNGWFMHDISMFPPAKNITPIFISFHCAKELLISENRAYFKAHAPIGCRDTATMELFHRYDIPAYFTGCLTLYFDPVAEKTGNVYAVDINGCPYIPPVAVSLAEYPDCLPLKHDLFHHFGPNDPLLRLNRAEKLLDRYRNAALVITTRLHAVLPCRAFGTRAKFIHARLLQDPRFSGLQEVLAGSSQLELSKESVAGEIIRHFVQGFDRIELPTVTIPTPPRFSIYSG
jgi:Polysaccharide pyruvyl transferase